LAAAAEPASRHHRADRGPDAQLPHDDDGTVSVVRQQRTPAGAGGDDQASALAAALTLCISRLLVRAALFGWMMPFAAALSMRLMARRRASSAPSSPAVRTALFTRVFSSLRTALLRSARFWFVL